jgi:hypothetical protein
VQLQKRYPAFNHLIAEASFLVAILYLLSE